jgi:hypothetical protein
MGVVLGEVEVQGNLPGFTEMKNRFPLFVARLLGMVGYRSAMQLYEENFKGQKLTYHPRGRTTKGRGRAAGMPASASGLPLVNYTVHTKAQEVRIHSFPENLFEKGRRLRSGKKQAGLWVMRSAKPTLRVHEYAQQAIEKILDDTSGANPFNELT